MESVGTCNTRRSGGVPLVAKVAVVVNAIAHLVLAAVLAPEPLVGPGVEIAVDVRDGDDRPRDGGGPGVGVVVDRVGQVLDEVGEGGGADPLARVDGTREEDVLAGVPAGDLDADDGVALDGAAQIDRGDDVGVLGHQVVDERHDLGVGVVGEEEGGVGGRRGDRGRELLAQALRDVVHKQGGLAGDQLGELGKQGGVDGWEHDVDHALLQRLWRRG